MSRSERILPTLHIGGGKGCSIQVVLALLLTAYVVLVLPAALGTLTILHRALDFYERVEERKQRRAPNDGGATGAVRRLHR